MTAEQFFGTGAMTLAVLGGFIGLPMQIYKNWQRKSVAGLSLTFWLILYTNGWFWLLYAFSKEKTDWYLVVANMPGLVFVSILLGQFTWYGFLVHRRMMAAGDPGVDRVANGADLATQADGASRREMTSSTADR